MMHLTLSGGAIVYEQTNSKHLFVRRYERNFEAAERSVYEALNWAKKHKQTFPVLFILDISSGTLRQYDQNDLSE